MIEPFKYLIQPVAIERDDDGHVIREIPGEIISVYQASQVAEVVEKLEEQLVRLNAEQEERLASSNGAVDEPPVRPRA